MPADLTRSTLARNTYRRHPHHLSFDTSSFSEGKRLALDERDKQNFGQHRVTALLCGCTLVASRR